MFPPLPDLSALRQILGSAFSTKPSMPRPTQTIGCEQAAYEFLRILGGWGRGILAGDARKGDTVQIKRNMDFRVKDATGKWSAMPKKVDIAESVLMAHEARFTEKVSLQMLSTGLDDFTDVLIRPIAEHIGRQIKQSYPNPNATLVMGVPTVAPNTVSFSACDSGAGIAVRVSKASIVAEDAVAMSFHVVFGFTGSALKIADIFQSPNEKEIAALETEKKRLKELLAKRSEDATKPPKFRFETDTNGPWQTKIGDTINVRMPSRFMP